MATRSLTYVIMGEDRLSPVLKKAGTEAEGTSKGIASGFSMAGLAAIGLATAIGGVLLKAISDARSEGWVPLQQAAKDAGLSMATVTSQAQTLGGQFAKLGFNQGDVNQSLTKMITATGSSSLALKAMGTAADFARFKHIDLASAAQLLTQAASGNTRMLRQVGISAADLPKKFATTGTEASRLGIVMDLLNKRIGGQAVAYAGTFGGKLDVLKAQIHDVGGSIGLALIPMLSSMLTVIAAQIMPALQTFANWFVNSGIPAIKHFGAEIAPIAGAILKDFALGVSTIVKGIMDLPGPFKIAGIAVLALGAAMKLAAMANPWILLATAIILVVGVIVKYWPQISAAFKVAWGVIIGVWNTCKVTLLTGFDALKNFVLGVWNAFSNSFPGKIIIALVKFMWAMIVIEFNLSKAIIVGVFDAIQAIATTTWNIVYTVFKGVWDYLLHPLWNVVSTTIKAIFVAIAIVAGIGWKAISTIFTTMWNNVLKPAIMFLWTTISTVFGFIINGAAKAFGWIPGIGGALKGAASAFNTFRDNVNNALNGVNNKTVNVSVAMTAATNPYPGGISGRAATGRKITGPGGPTSDTAGLFALSNDEWVIRAASANKYGYAAMDAVNRGQAIIGFAGGGGVTVSPHTPTAGSINSTVNNGIIKLATSFGQQMASSVGGSSPYTGSVSSGVQQWAGLVSQALSMLGLSQSLSSRVLYQMQTESGGNPNAINNTDSNAAAGDPSRGLLQTIMSTFMAYHVAGTSMNIYDPLANIAAAISYARARYGPSLMSGGMGMGSGHGYAFGTNSAARGWAWVGERGPELMHFGGGEQVAPMGGGRGGRAIVVNVTVQGHALASKQDIARTVSDALTYGEKHGVKVPYNN